MTTLLVSNIVLMVVLIFLFVFLQNAQWALHCSFRREFRMLDAVHEISQGIAADDMETATGALMEHFHKMAQELEWQNTHSYSLKHPLTMPELPDYATLIK